MATINLSWPLLYALPERFWGVMSNDTLLAIPFFTFMGIVLERSGMAEDLLDTIGQLFGPIRGGLAYAVIFVGALLAATTGVVAASVIAMGLISLPIMLRYGYDRRVASGVIAASGTLAQIIPPSLVLIVLADQLGRSVGDMYTGALIPGLVLTGLYMLYILDQSIVRPKSMPALPLEARTLGHGVTSLLVALAGRRRLSPTPRMSICRRRRAPMPTSSAPRSASSSSTSSPSSTRRSQLSMMSRLAQQVIIVLIPPLALIFLVLGTIFLGIATPTEGGAMGAVGALIMAAAKGRLSPRRHQPGAGLDDAASSFVMFILIGARVFSLTFYGVNGHLWVEHLLVSLPGGEVGFLIVVNILVFLLAFFLDFFELAFIIVPLLAPAADKLGIDLIWFGVLLGVNMQTSFMHPPFGFALFYLRSVAARVPYLDRITGKTIEPVTTGQIYWGAVPFVCIQVIMVGLAIAFPQMVMHYKGTAVDPSDVEIVVPPFGGNEQPGLGLPPLGAPADGGGNAARHSGPAGCPGNAGPLAAADLRRASRQACRPGEPDLSQPPRFN